MRFLPELKKTNEEEFLHPAGDQTGEILDGISRMNDSPDEEDLPDANQ